MIKCLLLTLIVSGSVFARNSQKVVYGRDNRFDVVDYPEKRIADLARSTAGMVGNYVVDPLPSGDYLILAKSLQISNGVCSTERFSNQLTAPNCSGFLVGDDLLVTAGHCITSNQDCQDNKWVFDYVVENTDYKTGGVRVGADSVYGCSSIISRQLDPSNQNDYSLIKLDRKVVGRRPLAIRKNGSLQIGDSVLVIGHPTGLPKKIADEAIVRDLRSKYFVTNLDTFGGNSGSAVLNSSTGEVEGILVRGERDYKYNSTLGCNEVYTVGAIEGRGEDVTYIKNVPIP